MKTTARTLVLLSVIAMMACSKDSLPTAPTPAPLQACERNNTAEIRFENQSRSTTQDIFWNGAKVMSLGPGQISGYGPIPAGVPHRLEFRITNTTRNACDLMTPTLGRCEQWTYQCPWP